MQLPGFSKDPKDKKRVSFNEDEISEHDKDRGTRMVIPDPDTPFMRSPVISDDESDTEAPARPERRDPQSLMAEVVHRSGSVSSADEDAHRHKEFTEKRKAFYNEFRVLKGIEKSPRSTADADDSSDASPLAGNH